MTAEPWQSRCSVPNSQAVRAVLERAAAATKVDQPVRDACRQVATADRVPWKLLSHACQELRQSAGDASQGPWLHQLARSAGVVFDAPPTRVRTAQLQQRLSKLQEQLDNQRYAAMVADIAQQEVASEEMRREGNFFPTTQLQLSFGLHVIVTMATFALLGYYAGHFATGNPTWAATSSAVGMTAAMLMETVLLMIRTSGMQHMDDKYAHLMDPTKYGGQRQRHEPPSSGTAAAAGGSGSSGAASGQGGGKLAGEKKRD